MYITNFNNQDEIQVVVIDLVNLNEELPLVDLECYGILGGIFNNSFMYSMKPYYLRQTYILRLVWEDYPDGAVLKDESVLVDNFPVIDGEAKILTYQRLSNETWNFYSDGWVYNNGMEKIVNIKTSFVYICWNYLLNSGCTWIGYEEDLIEGKCPICNSFVRKYVDQEKFNISPEPITKMKYID